MHVLRTTAPSHGFVCLMHEKPFAEGEWVGQAQQLGDLHRYRSQPA